MAQNLEQDLLIKVIYLCPWQLIYYNLTQPNLTAIAKAK